MSNSFAHIETVNFARSSSQTSQVINLTPEYLTWTILLYLTRLCVCRVAVGPAFPCLLLHPPSLPLLRGKRPFSLSWCVCGDLLAVTTGDLWMNDFPSSSQLCSSYFWCNPQTSQFNVTKYEKKSRMNNFGLYKGCKHTPGCWSFLPS